MHILNATSFYYPELKFGGPPLKIHGLSQGLRQHGHEVSVLTFFRRTRRALSPRTTTASTCNISRGGAVACANGPLIGV